MDLIVLNSLRNKKTCFGYNTNQIKLIDQDLSIQEFPLMEKSKVAKIILDEILFKNKYYNSINKILK